MRARSILMFTVLLGVFGGSALADDRLAPVPSFRLASLSASPEPGPAPPPGAGSSKGGGGGGHWFVGGGLGLSFGTVDFVEIVPVIGYRFSAPFAVGVQFVFRYRNDDRFPENSSTTDYGAMLFFQYYIVPNLYLEADYEYLSFELPYLAGERFQEGNFFLGLGYSVSIGKKSAFYTTILYNLTFDDNIPSAYTDPWLIRVGVSFGF